MAKDPAFLFYPNDWIGGTMGMTFEEKGAYIELLMAQFNRGHMSKHMIGQILGHNAGQIWDTVKDKFEIDPSGNFFNRRLEEEQNKRKSFTESRRNNLKGENQYTKKIGHITGHMSEHMENENINEDEIKILNKKEEIKNLSKEYFNEVMESFSDWRTYLGKQHEIYLKENEYTYQIVIDTLKKIAPSKFKDSVSYSMNSTYKKIFERPKDRPKTETKPKGINDVWKDKLAKLNQGA